MKELKRLKINQLSKADLDSREMSLVVGGACCGCGCNGPSSTSDNANANWNSGYSQSGGGESQCACWGDSSWKSGW